MVAASTFLKPIQLYTLCFSRLLKPVSAERGTGVEASLGQNKQRDKGQLSQAGESVFVAKSKELNFPHFHIC